MGALNASPSHSSIRTKMSTNGGGGGVWASPPSLLMRQQTSTIPSDNFQRKRKKYATVCAARYRLNWKKKLSTRRAQKKRRNKKKTGIRSRRLVIRVALPDRLGPPSPSQGHHLQQQRLLSLGGARGKASECGAEGTENKERERESPHLFWLGTKKKN